MSDLVGNQNVGFRMTRLKMSPKGAKRVENSAGSDHDLVYRYTCFLFGSNILSECGKVGNIFEKNSYNFSLLLPF